MLSMRFRSTDADATLRRLQSNAPPAVARALNRSITTARVFMRRTVAADVGLQQTVVDKDFSVRQARPELLKATLEVRGKRIPLAKFGATGPMPSRGRPPYVTAAIGGIRKVYGPRPGENTPFMAQMRSGHIGVFARVNPGARRSAGAWGLNLPIRELRGPSLVRVFIKHLGEGYAEAETALVRNLEHELAFAMRNVH